MKKNTLIVIVILLALSSVACDFTTTPDSMIRAPKSSEKQMQQKQEIISLLDKEEGLIIPKRMVNQSPYVRIDLDGDQSEEIVAFYRNRVNKFELGILILEQQEDRWRVRQNIAEYGIDIDYLHITDLNHDQSMELVVGLQSGIKNILHLYQLENARFVKTWEENYDYMDCGDIDGDQQEELLLVNAAIEMTSDTSLVEILEMQDNQMKTVYEAEVPGYCQNIKMGQVAKGIYGAYMVFYENYSQVQVKLIIHDEGGYRWGLDFPLKQIPPKNYQGKMFFDVDDDGILEVCHIVYPQNYRYGDQYTPALLEMWTRWNENAPEYLELVSMRMNNAGQGYRLELPIEWREGLIYECITENGVEFLNFYEKNKSKESYIGSVISVDYKQWIREENGLSSYPSNVMVLGRNRELDKIYIGLWAKNGMMTEEMMKKLEENIILN